jgi:hypothetical protein
LSAWVEPALVGQQANHLGLGFLNSAAVGKDHGKLAADGNDATCQLQAQDGGHQVPLDDVSRADVVVSSDKVIDQLLADPDE